MRRAIWHMVSVRSASCRWFVLCLAAGLVAPGCAKPKVQTTSVTEPPTVQVIQPQIRTIQRVIGQPSFVESYERTSIYPKVTGYIKKWYVDIGDKVKKDQVLATLFVPELEEDWETKKRTVKLDKERVDLALKLVEVARADVKAAEARLVEAKAILDKYQSNVDRWDSEVKRLKREVERGVVDPQVLLESQNQHRADLAARDAAKAVIAKADAELLSKRSTLAQDLVDVEVARARVDVAVSDAKRLEAWVGYLTLTSPYDGVVVARNANTGDFVMPLTGDPSADHNAPHLSPSGKAAPIYVIDRTDVVRIFVDVPEADANYVQVGTKATVLVRAFRDQLIPATVTRTSWALNVKSRTLRAEIDLHNTDNPEMYRDPGHHPLGKRTANSSLQLLPGMYAYGKVIIERPNVRALPLSALAYSGDSTYCWRHENGRAVRTEIQTGVSDGEWIEVTNRQLAPQSKLDEPWKAIDGSEQVILGDLSILAEGGPVKVDSASGETEIARATGNRPTTNTD